MEVSIRVNGRDHTLVVDPETPLLYVLRNDLELNGPKFGCGLGQCGACSVLIDGKAARSCITTVADARNAEIVTLEGLGDAEHMHPLQRAFVEEAAAQCGYCTSGMIMQAAAFLKSSPKPSEAEIRSAMADNLCRCGTHTQIIKAVQRAAGSRT
jgi:nicotinate dehydrogenase subunit A